MDVLNYQEFNLPTINSWEWRLPHSIFSSDAVEETVRFFLPLVGLIVLIVLLFLWRLKNRTYYNPYTKGNLPAVIRVKGASDKVFQGVTFVLFVCFYVWVLQQITIGKPLLIVIFIITIALFIYNFIRNYRSPRYALEIRNEVLYIFYKGTLKQTIPLSRIHHISFRFIQEGIATRIHPRIQIYTSKKEQVLLMNLSIESYLLLKTFFSRKRIKVTDDYAPS
ncbi:hypothetical protein [Capnocytophaga sp. HP1101]